MRRARARPAPAAPVAAVARFRAADLAQPRASQAGEAVDPAPAGDDGAPAGRGGRRVRAARGARRTRLRHAAAQRRARPHLGRAGISFPAKSAGGRRAAHRGMGERRAGLRPALRNARAALGPDRGRGARAGLEETAEASAVAAGEDRGGCSRAVCRRDPAPRQRRAGGGLARAGARAAHALHRSGERGSAPRAGRGRRSAAPGGARKARVPRAWADPPPRLSRDLAQASCRRPACRSPRAGPAGGRVQRAPRRPGPAQRRRDLARARGARSGEPRLGALLRRAGRGPGAARCAQRRGPLEAPPARSKAARTAMAALCRRAA